MKRIALLFLLPLSLLGQTVGTGNIVIGFGPAGAAVFLISEDFESGVNPGWTTANTGTGTSNFNDTTNVLVGSVSLNLNALGGNAAAFTNFTAQNEVWVGFKIKVHLSASDTQGLIRIQDGSGNNLARLVCSDVGSGNMLIKPYIGGTAGTATTATPVQDTSYFVWMHYKNNGTMDIEWESTNTRVGSGNNFQSNTDATVTAQASRFLAEYDAVGSNAFFIVDELRVSNTGYPSL